MVCDEILCPTVTCEKPFLPEGECCPLCNNMTRTTNDEEIQEDQGTGCFLEGDQILHPPGSKWHPYIPPFGFSRCATCTCDPESMKVECQSQRCPRLDCPADQQIRPDALACCKVHGVWKSFKMSHLNFWILAFSTNFCPIKIDLYGSTVWQQASVFQKLAKLSIFGIFNELLSTQNVNVARFARNVE